MENIINSRNNDTSDNPNNYPDDDITENQIDTHNNLPTTNLETNQNDNSNISPNNNDDNNNNYPTQLSNAQDPAMPTVNTNSNNNLPILNFKDKEYKIFLFEHETFKTRFQFCGTENNFNKFSKNIRISATDSKPSSQSAIARSSTSTSPIQPTSDSISKISKSLDFRDNIELTKCSKIFLTHLYKSIPKIEEGNSELICEQIDHYKVNHNFTLAYFQGFCLKDYKGNPIPTVLTERPSQGPLSSFIKSGKKITTIQKFAMICGITNGVCFIHKHDFIHSNLNPTTVYIDSNNHAKICDYIFIPSFKVTAEKVSDKFVFKYSYGEKQDPSKFDNSHYIAPEVLEGVEFGKMADVYSLGHIIFFILCGKDSEIDDKGEITNYPPELGDNWKDLINGCIKKNPSERLKAEAVLCKLFDVKQSKSGKFKAKKNTTKNNFFKNVENFSFFLSLEPKAAPNANANENPTSNTNANENPAPKANKYSSSVSSTIYYMDKIYLFRIYDGLNSEFTNDSCQFGIFQRMVPNIYEISPETRMIIKAAENGDIDCLEIVGNSFKDGKRNLYQDEYWSYLCYEEAAKRGHFNSMKSVIEFYQKGFCGFSNLQDVYEEYKKQTQNNDQELKEIEGVMKKLEIVTRTITLKEIPLDVTEEQIRQTFEGYQIQIEMVDPSEGQNFREIKLKFDKKPKYLRARAELKRNNIKLNGNEIKYKPYQNEKKEIHQYTSLSKDVKPFELDDYDICRDEKGIAIDIGDGSYGKIYKVENKKTKQFYAIKLFHQNQADKTSLIINKIKRELLMSTKLKFHPAILNYLGYNEFDLLAYNLTNEKTNQPTLLMDLVPNGTLEDAIKKQPEGWNNTAKLKALLGISSALAQMFAYNIIHRDLKTKNILLNDNFEPIVCDFGCARQVFFDEHEKLTLDGIGTPIYNPPELNLETYEEYTYEVDSYAFGVIMYQILADAPTNAVYSGPQNLKNINVKKLDNFVAEMPAGLNEDLEKLIRKCWNVSFNERPDPPMIFDVLKNAVELKDDLLPNLDIESVRNYMKTLPKIKYV